MRKLRRSSALFAVSLLAVVGIGAPQAYADGEVILVRSLKIKNTVKLSLTAFDPSMTFPQGSSWTPPDRYALQFLMRTSTETNDLFLPHDEADQEPRWTLSDGSVRAWKYRDDEGRRFSVAENGKIKLVVPLRGSVLSLPAAATRVLVELESISPGFPWKLCASFEPSAFRTLVAGERLVLGASSSPDVVTGCAERFDGCGDGELDGGEGCDDYNLESGDGCSSGCTTELCGDGVRNPQEDCDDGNTVSGDSCPEDCAICDSGLRAGNEECDPPHSSGIMGERACRDDCTLAVCGDGIVEAGEDCEASPGLDAACPGQCGNGGILPCSCPDSCDNGVLESGEDCEPGLPGADWSCNSGPQFGACTKDCDCCAREGSLCGSLPCCSGSCAPVGPSGAMVCQ